VSTAIATALICVMLAGGAVVVFALIAVPYLARQAFRARLGEIRDDTVDALLDGRLPRGATADAFLEILAVTAGRLAAASLTDNILAALDYCRQGISRPAARLSPAGAAGLRPAEREIMRKLENRACDAYQQFIIWASPVGWLTAPAILARRRLAPPRPAHACGQESAARPAAGRPGSPASPARRGPAQPAMAAFTAMMGAHMPAQVIAGDRPARERISPGSGRV
jgi:hypothetical protein